MLVSMATTIGTRSCIPVAVATVHDGSGGRGDECDLKTETTTEEEERSLNGGFLL